MRSLSLRGCGLGGLLAEIILLDWDMLLVSGWEFKVDYLEQLEEIH